jgi:hypothetical protein
MTSELLNKVFPLINFYFDKEGISATIANARKNDNTNENNYLLKDLQEAELYEMHMTIVSDKDVTERVVPIRKLQVTDYDKLNKVIKNKGENAILGNGIKIFNKAIEKIKGYDNQELVVLKGGEKLKELDLEYPFRKLAVQNGTVDNALNMERVEDILEICSIDVLEKLDAKMVKNALRLESEAATLGLELTKKDSFLKKLLEAKSSLNMTESVANFAVVIKQPKLAYTQEEIASFKILFEHLQMQYKNLQGQLNGIKKTIKDTIRIVEIELSKKYEVEFNEYNTKNREYQEKVNQINMQGEILKQQLTQELLALKIQTE